jgi:two-component system copper resistance phosphate regulon response regulator CusR
VRVLVIEDERKVAEALEEALTSEHYEVALAHTGEEGFFRIAAETFDLVILDLMLPGRDGFEIIEAVRRRGIQTPLLVLSARDAVEDRVIGLDSGADDYLVKPFAFPELLARVRAIVRRGRADQVLRLKAGDLEMDLTSHVATRRGEMIELTPREFQILEYLLRHHPRVVAREMLARDVLKESSRGPVVDNLIDAHIARIRRKVDHGHDVKLIHTVRGVGFALRDVGE